MSHPTHLADIKSFILEKAGDEAIDAAVILGSGLGGFSKEIRSPLVIPYSEIPNFPQTTVVGHSGSLIIGEILDKRVLAFSGRFHHYEGHDFDVTVLPVRVAHILDIPLMVVSNAAGGINEKFHVGDLMVIDDIIRFNKMTDPANSTNWRYNHYPNVEPVRDIATKLGIKTQRGNYIYVTGPNYESPAEIRAFRLLGADAVGMSTAPELMESARLGISSVAISLISNAAAGMNEEPLNHEEVKAAAVTVEDDFARLVKQIIQDLPDYA